MVSDGVGVSGEEDGWRGREATAGAAGDGVGEKEATGGGATLPAGTAAATAVAESSGALFATSTGAPARVWGCSRQRARAVGLGQAISLLIAGTGLSSSVLAREGVYAPTTQSLLNYVLLGIVFGAYRVARLGWRRALSLRVPAWRYALLAVVDVEANYLVVSAYASTSLASIQLLDCWTLPCAMLLSAVFLRLRYTRRHAAGVVVCMAGLATLIATDWATSVATGTDTARGDLLCLAGATLYAVSNVAQEVIVKEHDRTEFLAALGGFGAVVAGVQIAVLERAELASAAWGAAGVTLPFLAFAACLFGMYCATTTALRDGDATLFNLSLLTSDAWAIAISAALGDPLHPLIFLALAAIVAGIVIYNGAGAPRPASASATPATSALPPSTPLPPTDATALMAAAGATVPRYDASPLLLFPESSASTTAAPLAAAPASGAAPPAATRP